MTPDPAAHWVGRLTWWVLHHGDEFLPLFWVLWTVIIVSALAYLYFLQGARVIAAAWGWRRAWRWWRARSSGHPGGTGGHSDRYEAVMQSAGWRRRRAQAIRRAGHRCQECGARGRLDVHHMTYSHLGAERPWQLAALCKTCHQAVHRERSAA